MAEAPTLEGGTGLAALWRFFRRPEIWRLCLGRWTSDWGDAVHILAFNWLLVQQTGSAAAVGLCQALWIAGQLAFSWPGGWLVDRLGPRALLLTSYGLHGALIATFAALAFWGWTNLWLLGGISIVLGVLGAPTDPAHRSLTKQIAPENADLVRLNGLLSSGGAAAQCLGPLLAGWMLMAVPGAWAFALNALSFAAAAVALAGVRPKAPRAAAAPPLPAAGRAPLLAVLRPLLGPLIAASGFIFGPAALLVVFLPYYVQQVQHWPIAALGTLEAARWLGLGIGTVLGSLLLGRLAVRLSLALAVSLASLLVPLAGFALSASAGWMVQAGWLAALGAAAGVAYVLLNLLFLQEVRAEWMGRVNGGLAVYVGLGLLVFGALWWLTIERIGYPVALRGAIALFAACLIPAALAALRPRLMKCFSLDNRSQEP
ncbi:MFS transporter [Gloeobacter morelensis]|uniref:MFS transporter n=1 Tax=Gloeobacter morelensis MG652769 TaxID=2781736 RepID=A0ABY3PLI9_9CYAN|nr:MFS transporter [Gloeobacter morelensis]UFP94541.1 MFS transporter [Gloeobacter morelensis MG652769]